MEALELKVICPFCEENKTSSVRNLGTATTMLAINFFHDEEGKYHSHDSNESSTHYSCSNGHKWHTKSHRSCWCGWNQTQEIELVRLDE